MCRAKDLRGWSEPSRTVIALSGLPPQMIFLGRPDRNQNSLEFSRSARSAINMPVYPDGSLSNVRPNRSTTESVAIMRSAESNCAANARSSGSEGVLPTLCQRRCVRRAKPSALSACSKTLGLPAIIKASDSIWAIMASRKYSRSSALRRARAELPLAMFAEIAAQTHLNMSRTAPLWGFFELT